MFKDLKDDWAGLGVWKPIAKWMNAVAKILKGMVGLNGIFIEEVDGTIRISGGSGSGGGGLPRGLISMWSGGANSFDETGLGINRMKGWALCNGENGTPDLRGRFIVGADTREVPPAHSDVTYQAGNHSEVVGTEEEIFDGTFSGFKWHGPDENGHRPILLQHSHHAEEGSEFDTVDIPIADDYYNYGTSFSLVNVVKTIYDGNVPAEWEVKDGEWEAADPAALRSSVGDGTTIEAPVNDVEQEHEVVLEGYYPTSPGGYGRNVDNRPPWYALALVMKL